MSSVEYHYPVIGRKGTGGIFDRLPIQTLEKDHPYQFALFILAFNAIQQRSDAPHVVKEPAATFMEIASIHGKPLCDRLLQVSRHTSSRSVDLKPFFSHGAVVFPTWHRSYVMLIEQSIENVAEQLAHVNEADTNPDENGVWIKAAKELRFPYWDWAGKDVPENGLPPVLYEEKVEIMATGGKKQIVDNPLSFFSYVGGIPADFSDEKDDLTGQVAYFSKWRRTYRYAYSTPDPEGTHIYLLQKMFKAGAKNLRLRVAHLFTFNDDENSAIAWDEFSNHTAESKRDTDFVNRGSLEGVHDTVHLLLSHPDYAGFDPIFFLLHSNVDRLLALWEWCYTEYWMGSGYEDDGGQYPWTQVHGPPQPFRTEQGNYWTSSQARFLHEQSYPKYYSFPEFEGIKVDQTAMTSQERALARKRMQAYYDFDPQIKVTQVASHTWKHLPVPNKENTAVPNDHTVIPHYRTFIVHVKLLEHAYNHSYSFQLYHRGNAHSTQLVGTVARPDHSPCKAIRDLTLAHIKGEFVGRLVDAAGLELAVAEGGLQATQVPRHCTTSRTVTPVEISLVSAAVAEHVEDKDRPVYLCDWQHHGDIFNGGWLATHKDSVH
ncbi:uncharacterized protein F5147DRAFT_744943 [Suillus discolor]|uniref:tyrosinase n=1 Tax=Suillus discolor TaxID=1912936 RepID=A0A9P7FBZ7_9AGAM|nr:uncharacterized protein F5147DRAFT_744943 [Suillus discolor]KAG2111280.1 hypothetical protein F5147DRAFT_744943 [Suillus discolor]